MGQPSFASRIEFEYVRPALTTGTASFHDRPIMTTFLAIFFSLSVLPVLAFLGTVSFAIVSFTLAALAVVFIASSAVVLGLFAILASVLLGALFASAFFTFVAISAYLFFRLFVLVRQEGVSGVSEWACEIKSHILNITNRHNSVSYSYGTQDQHSLSDTRESIVDIHEQEARSSDYHDEKDYDVKVQG